MKPVISEFVPEFYQPLVTERLARVGYGLVSDVQGAEVPRLVIDGAGSGALGAVANLSSAQARRTVVLTRHTDRVYTALLARKYVMIAEWGIPDAALAFVLQSVEGRFPYIADAREDVLSPREAEALTHLLLGRSTDETGERMGIHPKSVSAHVSNVMRRHGYRDRTDLMVRMLTAYDTPRPKGEGNE